MSPSGIGIVARQEFTIRIRSGRQRWILGIWFVVLVLLTALIKKAMANVALDQSAGKGVVIYGALTLVVLGISLLVAPGLSCQSINGDRDRGTLATMQVTRLTAGDIAVGKFLAAWGTAIVFVLVTAPVVAYAMTQGDVGLSRVLVVTGVLLLLLASVIAIALCLSSLVNRTSASGMLSYLVVFLLTFGTLISYGISQALLKETKTITRPAYCPSDAEVKSFPPTDAAQMKAQCGRMDTFTEIRPRGDKVWWLLAPNPYVILADAAPQLSRETPAEVEHRRQLAEKGQPSESARDSDPLGAIGRRVRDIRLHPGEVDRDAIGPTIEIVVGETGPTPSFVHRRLVWPYGLAFDVLLGAAALWLTTRRLRTPTRKLGKGQRVA